MWQRRIGTGRCKRVGLKPLVRLTMRTLNCDASAGLPAISDAAASAAHRNTFIEKTSELLAEKYNSASVSINGRLHLNWSEQRMVFAPSFSGHIKEIKGFSDGVFDFDAAPQQAGGEIKLKVLLEGGEPELPDIENRGITYPPPTEHQGRSIAGASPLDAARKGVVYYATIYEEAANEFGS